MNERSGFGMLSPMNTIGERIRYLRKEVLGLTQEQFAARLQAFLQEGSSPTRGAVGNWELGGPISGEYREAISSCFHVSLDWLAKGEGEAPPRKMSDIGREVVDLMDRQDRTIDLAVAAGRLIRSGRDVEGFDPANIGRIPIRGEVAAGRWLETPAFLEISEITEFVDGLAIPPSQVAYIYGLRVRGTSINKIAGDGATLVCLDVTSGIEIRDRDVVIVERVRDQGALREVTAKRLLRRNGKLVLTPESTDPMWQSTIELDDAPQDDSEIRIVAKVKHVITTL